MEGYREVEGFPDYIIGDDPPKVFKREGSGYKELKQTVNSKKDKYWTVTLRCSDTGKYLKRSVHRLYMLTFVPNPECKPQVNHIDGDKSNNLSSNLEWVTAKENSQHAINNKLLDPIKHSKKVYKYSLSGEYLKTYRSAKVASRELGIEDTNIRSCCLGRRDMAGNFQWRYEREDRINPTKRKYIKGYSYKGAFFNTLKELGEKLGKSKPDKLGLGSLRKEIREGLEIIYYE